MNKHWVLGLLAAAALMGCSGSSEMAVRAVTSTPEGDIGRNQLEVRVLPYDRDALFERYIGAATRPEPEPPADLLELRDSIAAAQERWRDAEGSWNEVYAELKDLSERMDGMNTASTAYFEAFQRFEDLDAQERRLRRDKDGFFDAFTALQSQYTARADSFNAVVATWEDEVFEGYGETVDSLLEALGREELWDTTDASGFAYFTIPKGEWWVHTRAKLPFDELYWNVPLQIAGGAADTLTLNASNAQVRPVF